MTLDVHYGSCRSGRLAIAAAFWVLIAVLFLVSGCGKEKIIIRYRDFPGPVQLAFPPPDTLITTTNPTFYWHPSAEAERYQLQVSRSTDFVEKSIDVKTTDTTYTTISELANSTYFWRVRARNIDDLWGDWSDADVWSFFKSDYVDYVNPISQIHTYGSAQDVFLRNDTAYVADGQADLTVIDVSDPSSPWIIRNIDTHEVYNDDIAQAVFVAPADTFPYAFVADMDGRLQAINISDTTFLTLNFFGPQNIEDLTGLILTDTLYLFGAYSRGAMNPPAVGFYQVVYDPLPRLGDFYFPNPVEMPADANGIFADADGRYVYVAGGVAGLRIIDISDLYNPVEISSLELPGTALSVYVQEDYAFVAADREGLFVIDVSDRLAPALAAQVNTAGRTKDVDAVGDYAFIADGSGGLKIIDVNPPDSAHFVVRYSTSYALGVWADSQNVYVCDRDEGLIIFENLTSR